MLVSRRRLAALAAAGLLATPASALGQSAGDEQYQDPFGGEEQGSSGDESAPAPESAPTAPAPDAAPSTTEGDPTAPATQSELPRTGADTGLILLGGTILLAGGVALRVRLRERPER